MTAKPPLPLDGEGAGGWGGAAPGQDMALGARSDDRLSPAQSICKQPAPTQPSPIEGEGFDRFERRRHKEGAVPRARRLRGDQTLAERRLWERLRLLPIRFRRQAPIGPYVVDFACHAARLVVEVDGGVHDRTDVALRDLERDNWLSTQGYRVLRIANRRVIEDIESVIAEITKAAGVSLPGGEHPASTPSQPFPIEGKGFSEL